VNQQECRTIVHTLQRRAQLLSTRRRLAVDRSDDATWLDAGVGRTAIRIEMLDAFDGACLARRLIPRLRSKQAQRISVLDDRAGIPLYEKDCSATPAIPRASSCAVKLIHAGPRGVIAGLQLRWRPSLL
jgi:hypothetical protein